MTTRKPTAGRDAAPAFSGARGIAPGSIRTSLLTLDRNSSRWDQQTTLRGVIAR